MKSSHKRSSGSISFGVVTFDFGPLFKVHTGVAKHIVSVSPLLLLPAWVLGHVLTN